MRKEMKTIMSTPAVLPAVLYDAMRALAETHGGVGHGSYFVGYAPCCAVGLAAASHGHHETGPSLMAIEEALKGMGLYYKDSDNAVCRLLNAGYGTEARRVPFDLWAKTLPVLRGA